MRKNLIVCLIILAFTFPSEQIFGQDRNGDGIVSFKERLFYGGNFWLQWGTVTFIDVSPVVGYRVNERFSMGPGLVYNYYKERIYYSYNSNLYNFDYKTNVYGGKIFGQFTVRGKIKTSTGLEDYSLIGKFQVGKYVPKE